MSKIYSISKKEVSEIFNKEDEMHEFLEIYKVKLKKYFKYVVEIGVPKDRKTTPKKSDYRKYYLLYCTNNESGLSLVGHKKKDIRLKMRDGYMDLKEFSESLPEVPE